MKKIKVIFILVIVLSIILGCGNTTTLMTDGDSLNRTGDIFVEVDTGDVEKDLREGVSVETSSDSTEIQSDEVEGIPVIVEHEDPSDADHFDWDEEEVASITLDNSNITVVGSGVTVENQIVRITSTGTYNLEGSLQNGQIIIDTEDDGRVRLILNGVDISNSTSSPLYVKSAEKTVIVLAEDTENYFSDGGAYVYAMAEETEPNATIFSQDDLIIGGEGTLIVTGHYNDGITSKDGLLIQGGDLQVTVVDDGIRGKDYLVIQDSEITIQAGGDGLKSDNTEDTAVGYITVENSVINITSGGDAFEAESDVHIISGQFTLVTSSTANILDTSLSAKGIKGINSVVINQGVFTISSTDDAIHSNNVIIINGGTFQISTGDDGLHADAAITINGGEFTINESYEGIESAVITINAGTIHINSSDDGLNIAGGNDGSGMEGVIRMPGRGRGAIPQPGDQKSDNTAPGQDAFTYNGEYYLNLNGGYIVINAGGDGWDINGAIVMTDGLVIINGPTENFNGALDYDGTFSITGGTLIAVGSARMAQVPGSQSAQNSVLVNFSSMLNAGTLIHIQSSDGKDIVSFSPTKPFQSIAYSSAALSSGTSYDLYLGGSVTGTAVDGLYPNAGYSPGTQYTSFTISGVVTQLRSR